METPTREVRREHQAFERLLPFLREDLKQSSKHYCGLFHDDGLVSIHDDPEKAFSEGLKMYGLGNFRVVLLRKIQLLRIPEVLSHDEPEQATAERRRESGHQCQAGAEPSRAGTDAA